MFAGLAAQGASGVVFALEMILAAALLLGSALISRDRRRELSALSGLGLPALLFAAVIFVVVLSLTPFVPGGPHPIWAYLGMPPGAATLDKSRTLMELIRLLGLACIFGIGIAAGASDTRAQLAADIVLMLGAALIGWSFFDLMEGGQGIGRQRIDGPFDSANTMATLSGALLLVAIARMISRYRAGGLVAASLHASAALVMIVTLLATASRGGGTATAAGLVTFAALQVFGGKLSWSRAMLAGVVSLLVVAVLIVVGGDLLVTRLMEQQIAGDPRETMFAEHWKAFQAAPIMGYGLGTFDAVNRTLLGAANFNDLWNVRAVHNVYLNWLELAGVAGAAPMFACIAVVIVVTLRFTMQRRRMTSLLFGLLAADAVVLAHGTTDFALEIYGFAALWAFLLGLQFSLAQTSSRR